MKATLNYLDCIINIDLPNPEEDNTVRVLIERAPLTYDPELYNAYLDHFQFSGESQDPNNWILEAIEVAIRFIKARSCLSYYVESSPNSEVLDTDIPF
jgi:hypothetical protein